MTYLSSEVGHLSSAVGYLSSAVGQLSSAVGQLSSAVGNKHLCSRAPVQRSRIPIPLRGEQAPVQQGTCPAKSENDAP
ncbi:MAG: hypothetical protein ACPGWR_09175 [Ardenticatenaceae bacterium]